MNTAGRSRTDQSYPLAILVLAWQPLSPVRLNGPYKRWFAFAHPSQAPL